MRRGTLIEAVSMDLGQAFLKSVQADGHAPQALVCADVFHLVKLVGDALDEVRRDLWQQLRKLPDDRYVKEQFRAIFTYGLAPATAINLLDRWITRALRSRLEPFIKAARTIRDRRLIIINAIERHISNGRVKA